MSFIVVLNTFEFGVLYNLIPAYNWWEKKFSDDLCIVEDDMTGLNEK